MFQALAKNFLRGLLFVVPIAFTAYVLHLVVVTVDGWVDLEPWLGRSIPGSGLVLTLLAVTLVGFLARFFVVRWLFQVTDAVLGRLPLVKLLYTSIRDLINAFVGQKKRFGQPVVVSLNEGGDVHALGFLTREDLSEFGLPEHHAVYVPQSYNFAGNLIAVPRHRVRHVTRDSAAMMTFVVSGGISGLKKKGDRSISRKQRQ